MSHVLDTKVTRGGLADAGQAAASATSVTLRISRFGFMPPQAHLMMISTSPSREAVRARLRGWCGNVASASATKGRQDRLLYEAILQKDPVSAVRFRHPRQPPTGTGRYFLRTCGAQSSQNAGVPHSELAWSR